ncbi:MAG TPA: isoamylase [Acidobacteriaceae bacterium]|nr:isoamylase [Acidobacteriaceae bacterium]
MAAGTNWYSQEGTATPLGVTWIEEEQAFNFALYSKHASEVTLLLFSAADEVQPAYEFKFNPLIHKSGRVWHCRMRADAISGSRYYAYRVAGPNEAGAGHRFDDQKILFDPYARALHFPKNFSREVARIPGSNAGRAPLGVLMREPVAPRPRRASTIHTSDLVIYELHVRGFTARASSGVSAEKRGTFAGLADKIPYLAELGITAVELMPVTQQDPQEGSRWGYMPLGFFAPHRGYSKAESTSEVLNEFREMVQAFHAANMEVILDVVYSHTGEGDEAGPIYSFKGIDNSTYYLLEPDWRHYRDDTKTGNVLNCANHYVRKMIVDSLNFWVREMQVDGFRFDLASIFTRKQDGSIDLDDPPILAAVNGALDLSGARLIAEAWDPASYQLGKTFPGISWLQWNGKFRDDVRAFLRGDGGMVTSLMTRLYGSADLFPDDVMNAYHPYQSVNFATCHDGFSLYDLVAYNQKHNEENGHNNTDGTDNNLSWNCGWEGDPNAPDEVLALRRRQVKNFCCLLLLSNGTPMLRAGDEFMNTQRGNNNPYNQDNQTTWLDWDLLKKNYGIFRFFQRMIAFRKAHPSIARSRFWREDVRWFGVGQAPDLSFNSHTLAYHLRGASQHDSDLYVMINAYWEDLTFAVQEGEASEWRRVIDTGHASPVDFCDPESAERLSSLSCNVRARSIVVLVRS